MARHLRVEFPGAIYHVTCRMIGDGRLDRSRLFVDEKDRERFVGRLADRVRQYNIRLYLFVCMGNHFHMVFETPEGNCSRFMQSLSTAYTVYYNLRHGRHGHLLDGRFKAKLVAGDEYLLALTRYVHLNPVKVGSMKRRPMAERIQFLRQYPWSTYPGYLDKRKGVAFVEYGPILAMMHGKPGQWAERYRAYVESGLAEDDEDFKMALKASPRSIGSDGFRAWVDALYQRQVNAHQAPEDASFRRITEPVPVNQILATLSEGLGVEVAAFRQRLRDSGLRAIAARMLTRFGGQTQREVAGHLMMGTGGAVSAQLRRLPGLLAGDTRLRHKVERMEHELTAKRKRSRDSAGKRRPNKR